MYRQVFFFNDTATTEIYTLSLHDALPISRQRAFHSCDTNNHARFGKFFAMLQRSEEHTTELQSQSNLVCRLLLEKKNNTKAASSASSDFSTTHSHASPTTTSSCRPITSSY